MTSHQISRRELIFLAASALPALSEAQTTNPASFELQVNNGVRLINEWKYLSQDKGGLWQKQWLIVTDIKYDVAENASALRPFIGILKAAVVVAAGIRRPTRIEAEKELSLENATNISGGKNSYALEYDLKFEPKAPGWLFLEGKVRDSFFGEWSDIPTELVRNGGGVSGYVIRSFATPVPMRRKTSPNVRAAPKHNT